MIERLAWLTRQRRMSRIQLAAWCFAAAFLGVVLVGHLPGVNDEEGRLFGLFHITLYQDLLHGGSGVWAAIAAWYSVGATLFYFRWFGTVYFVDGVFGAIWGRTILDGGIFLGLEATDPSIRLLVNVPHLLIGGSQIVLGFVLAKKWG